MWQRRQLGDSALLYLIIMYSEGSLVAAANQMPANLTYLKVLYFTLK